MTAVQKRSLRAAEYHDRALAASALAEASPLAQVREKHERAAIRWRELAELNEERVAAPGLQAPVPVES